jgi:hypothetical protein
VWVGFRPNFNKLCVSLQTSAEHLIVIWTARRASWLEQSRRYLPPDRNCCGTNGASGHPRLHAIECTDDPVSATGFDGNEVAQPITVVRCRDLCASGGALRFLARASRDSPCARLSWPEPSSGGHRRINMCRRYPLALLWYRCQAPCSVRKSARRVGRTGWVKLTVRENRTGFYLRMFEAGAVQQGAWWDLQERLNDRASIPAINRCFYLEYDPDLASEFAEKPGLADWWKKQFREKLWRISRHWSEDILL